MMSGPRRSGGRSARYIVHAPASTAVVLTVLLFALTAAGGAAISGIPESSIMSVPAPGWRLAAGPGFGSASNIGVSTLDEYGGLLYAGTWNDQGAQVWRTASGTSWERVASPWTAGNVSVMDAQSFGPFLYISTANETGAELWRLHHAAVTGAAPSNEAAATSAVAWERVVSGGLGDPGNYTISALATFQKRLYLAMDNLTTGTEIWRSGSGNQGDWSQVNADGFGGGPTFEDAAFGVFQGQLFVAVSRVVAGRGRAELWRSPDGTQWSPVFTDGLGYADNGFLAAFEEFGGALYAGMRNDTTGAQLWRSNDGSEWTPVFTDGLGERANNRVLGLISHAGRLYVILGNAATGAEIWSSVDGGSWQVAVRQGWGNPGNHQADYFDRAGAIYRDALYFGTVNVSSGGEIWRTGWATWLPLTN